MNVRIAEAERLLILRLAQMVNLAALGTMLGTATFLLTICQPLAVHAAVRGSARHRSTEQLRHVWLLAYAASVAAILLWFCAECVMVTGRPLPETAASGQIWTILGHTQFGRHYIVHLGLAAVPAAYLAAGRRQGAMAPWEPAAACILSAGLLSHMSSFSHAAAMSDAWRGPLLASYTVHLAAAGIWLGGLPPLFLVLLQAHRHQDAASLSFARDAARRFSALGIVCVWTLLATGIFNAKLIVGGWTAIVGSDYGRLLIGKVLLFGVMMAIAAINKFRLMPALAAMSHGVRPNAARPVLRLLGNVGIESAMGLAILGIAATLGSMAPGR